MTQTPPLTLTDLLFAKVSVGMCLVAPDSTIVRANSEWLRATGFTEEQVVGESIIDLFPDTRDMALALHARARAGHRVEVPRHAQTVNGRATWWEGSVEPVPMEGGTGLLIVAREVVPEGATSTAAEVSSKRVEEMLRTREAQFRILVEELHSGVALIDASGRFTLHNRRFLEMFGLSRESDIENVNSQNWAAWQVFDEAGRLLGLDEHPVRRATLTRQPVRNQLVAVRLPSGGDLRWMLVSAEPMLGAGDAVEQVICTYHEVTDRKRAEDDLRQAKEALQRTIDSITDGLLVLDRDWRYTYVSARAGEILGIAPERLVGGCVWDLFPHAVGTRFHTEYHRAVETQRPVVFEEFYPEPLHLWLECRCYPSEQGLTVYFHDVTDRKRAEEARKRHDELLTRLFERVPVMIAMYDPAPGNFRFNDELRRVLGWTEADAAAGDFMSMVYPDPADRAAASEHMTTLAPGWREVRATAKDGSKVPTVWANIRLADDTQVGIGIDLRDRKHAESALRESVARYERQVRLFESVTSTTPDFVYLFDVQGRFLYANRRLLEVWGMALPDVVGKTCRELGYEQWHHDMHMREIAQVIETRKAIKGEVPFRAPLTGIFGIYEYIFTPVIGSDGEVEIIAGTTRDVTERKRGEEELRAAAERLRLALEAAHMVAWEYDLATKRVTMSENAQDVLALRSGRIHGDSDEGYALIHPEDVEKHRALVTSAIERAGGYVSTYRQVGDGDVRWIEERGRAVADASGKTVRLLGVTQNITERKRAEEEVRRGREKLDAALASMTDAVLISDAEGRPVHFNSACATFYRFRSEAECLMALSHRSGMFEARAADATLAAVDEWPLVRALRGETATNAVYRLRRKDTDESWIASYSFAPIRDERGAIVGAVVVARDITETERTREALLEANARLRDADRRKDEFLGMLGHELRNPLAPIRNSIYVLQHALGGSDRARRAQTVIQRQTEHLTRLVDDLLDVTRIVRGKIELRRAHVDVRDVVARAAEDFRVLLHDRGVRFEVALPDERLQADADATRITQVVGNLLHNASKFTRRGDTVTLSMAASEGAAEIRVRDTGAGIAPELLPRIFDAFVQGARTLARSEGGLGLGLALVKGLTELHGGTVAVESAGKGKGAEFVVRLPLAEPVSPPAQAGGVAVRAKGGRRVLVVDDNVDAAESLADLVRMLGHDAEVAFDGPTAIAAVKASPPDVVLCDVGLPGMNGYEVAKALRASGIEGMQLVAVSGYAQPEDVTRALAAGFDAHLAKPPDPAAIERLLA